MDRNLTKIQDAVPATENSPSKGPSYKVKYAGESLPTLEGVQTTWELFCNSVKKYPHNNMLGRREIVDGAAGNFIWETYKDIHDTVKKISSAFRFIGLQPQGRIGIYGSNCPQWVTAMEACNSQTIYCVPLYDSLGPHAIEYIVNHALISCVVVQESKISALLKGLNASQELVTDIVSMGIWNDVDKASAEGLGIRTYSWEEFKKLGEENPFDFNPPSPDDICTIMYTSGTTGDPKGVLIKNSAVISLIASLRDYIKNAEKFNNFTIDESDVYLSFLPLAHIFDRASEEFFIFTGASIGFWQGDVKLLIDDITALRPTMFFGVPRIFDKIYSGIKEKVNSGGFIKKFLFNYFYDSKLHNLQTGVSYDKASYFGDKLVFGKVKERLGGRVKLILSGAAPLAPHVEEFLKVTFCAPVVQGYGLTETCSGGFISEPNKIEQSSTVGPPITAIEVRLESVPEMNYDALSNPPRGEICLKGPTLFSGYYKQEDLTREAIDADGWFHTGDVGEWQRDGIMKIIDRKKNIFKLSQGEYVAVENLENVYGNAISLEQIWVYGNSFESTLVAVAVPKEGYLLTWAQSVGIEGDYATVCATKEANQHILKELTDVGKKAKLKGFEMIKSVYLDTKQFDIERDLITPTFKKKRPQLLKYYKEKIDLMYSEIKEAEAKKG